MQSEQISKKTLASAREAALKSSLPAFKLHDPFYSPLTISLCPSSEHPLSELPKLIHSVCNDGIPLPSGEFELEGGPYTAVAFDMEWEISYTRGHENKTALIQIASRSQALIIQLSSTRPWYRDGIMPQCLIDFLSDPQIVKLGVGIRNDGLKLLRDHSHGPKPYLNSLLELSRLTRSLGPLECDTGYSRLISLQGIVADHLKVYLPKDNARISEWTKPLSLAQLDYATSDVIATIRVAQRIFRLFQEKLKSNPSQLILDFIESLEPSLERDQTSRPPVVSSSREWMTIQPPSKDLITKSKEDRLKRRFINPLKTHVSPRVKQAWELWYYHGLSVEQCAKKMKIKPTSVAIYLGKMLIHFNLNSMNLNDYIIDKLKTDQLNNDMDKEKLPKETADTGEITETVDQTDTRVAAISKESGIVQILPEDGPESNILKGTTTAIEEISQVSNTDVRVTEMIDLEVKVPVGEECDKLHVKNLVCSTLSDGLLPEKDEDNVQATKSDIIETVNQECDIGLAGRDVIDNREPNSEIETATNDSSVSLNSSIRPAESSSDPEKETDSWADRIIDPSEANPNIKSTSPEAIVNLPIGLSENICVPDGEIESTVKNLREDGERNLDLGTAPAGKTGCMNPPIEQLQISSIPESETDSTQKNALHVDNSTERIVPHATESTIQISGTNPIIERHDSSLTPHEETDPMAKNVLDANLSLGAAPTDQILSTDALIESWEDISIHENEGESTEKDVLHVDEANLDIGTTLTDEIGCMNPPEKSLIPEEETDLVEKGILQADEQNLDITDETQPAEKSVLDAGESTLDIGTTLTEQIGCTKPPTGPLESRLDLEKEGAPTVPSVLGQAQPTLYNLPMKIFRKSKMKDGKSGTIAFKNIDGDVDINHQIDQINQAKMVHLKSLILKFHVHETLGVGLKAFGFF